MELIQYRVTRDDKSTVGILFRDGASQAYTLEDEKRDVKVRGEARIPAGRYRILPRMEGGMVQRYRKRFRWHRGMLWLQDVPGFDWIYYHVGNFDSDTEGCILVGSRAVTTPGRMALLESVPAYETFYKAVIDAAEAGELWTTIIDRDG